MEDLGQEGVSSSEQNLPPPSLGQHPRVRGLRAPLGDLLQMDDPTELDALLEDIQTLLYRCGYHLRGSSAARQWMLEQKRARLAARRLNLGTSPRRAPGRHAGAMNFAARQLGLGLAQLFSEVCGRSPTRRWNPDEERETGAYRGFVQLVVNCIPKPVWTLKSGHVPDIDYLVRSSITQYKLAQRSGSEAERRGVLDDSRWLR